MKFNKLVPELVVLNIEKSLDFYKSLGFKVDMLRANNKFAFLSFEGSQIMLQQSDVSSREWETGKLEYPYGRGINFQFEVKNVQEIYNKANSAHLKIKVPLAVHVYGDSSTDSGPVFKCKEFLIQDVNGYLLRFSEVE